MIDYENKLYSLRWAGKKKISPWGWSCVWDWFLAVASDQWIDHVTWGKLEQHPLLVLTLYNKNHMIQYI